LLFRQTISKDTFVLPSVYFFDYSTKVECAKELK